MTYKNLFLKDNIQDKYIKSKKLKNLSKKFDKIFLEIKSDVKNTKKTLNVLDNNFKFNFRIKELKKFKKFKTIVLIGMGGSILGSEAIYNFLQIKVKKRLYFFNNLDENKIKNLKKKRKFFKSTIYYNFKVRKYNRDSI